MAICDATGPRPMLWVWPWTVWATAWPLKVSGTPCQMRKAAVTMQIGSRM